MLKTIAFILLRLVATLLAITFLTFLMVALLPGDPVDTILGTGPREPEQVEQIRDDLNLDDPFLVRYFAWLGDAVTGDLGDSYITDQPVSGDDPAACAGHRAVGLHGDLHRGARRRPARRTRCVQAVEVAGQHDLGGGAGRAVDPELHRRDLPHLAVRRAMEPPAGIELEPIERRHRRQSADRPSCRRSRWRSPRWRCSRG